MFWKRDDKPKPSAATPSPERARPPAAAGGALPSGTLRPGVPPPPAAAAPSRSGVPPSPRPAASASLRPGTAVPPRPAAAPRPGAVAAPPPGATKPGTAPAAADKTNPPAPAGRIAHDARGNAVWNWAVSAGQDLLETTSRMLKRLEIPGLSIEDKPRELELDDNDPHGGHNPYERAGKKSRRP